jgi:PAXNEB protein
MLPSHRPDGHVSLPAFDDSLPAVVHAEPGTLPGPYGQTLVSTGLADLDQLLGGGLPLGCLLLVIEDSPPEVPGVLTSATCSAVICPHLRCQGWTMLCWAYMTLAGGCVRRLPPRCCGTFWRRAWRQGTPAAGRRLQARRTTTCGCRSRSRSLDSSGSRSSRRLQRQMGSAVTRTAQQQPTAAWTLKRSRKTTCASPGSTGGTWAGGRMQHMRCTHAKRTDMPGALAAQQPVCILTFSVQCMSCHGRAATPPAA